jgi:hypothetical protein
MATNGDIKAHENTYSGFMVFLKWGAAISFITGMITVFLIAN